ncbi:MAG: alpha/beta hydrolase [Chloroflexota bacterium]|nr:alpha/beta hydrolase [Chloroflexota bacterium]
MSESAANAQYIHQFIPGKAGAPTLLLLHGTGGNETDLLGLGRALDGEAALLSPRGTVLEQGMPRFFRRLAEGVFDLDDLTLRTHELADFVADAAVQYGFDPARVIAVGFSNGANIAASMLLLRPETLAAAVLFRPMAPLIPETLPDLARVPVFIGSGRQDPIVLVADVERLVALLRQAGATVTHHWEASGHNLTQGDLDAARQWMAKRLVA